MLEHAEAAAPEPAVSPDLPLPVGAEVEPMLEHAEAAAPEAAVSPELPLAVGGEVEPILEHAEAALPEAAVSPDLPLPVGAEVELMLEHAEPALPEAAVSPELALPVGAEVEPILEHAEPPEASGNVYTAQKDYDGATAKYSEAIKLEPKFPVAYENRSHIKDKAGEGSIGVTIRRVTDGAAHALNVKPACGALVVDMDENGPAKAAGIEPRDVIVKVDGRDVKEWRDLPRIVANVSIGKEIAVTIVRNGKELTKTVKVGRLEYADEQASLTSHKGRPLQEQPVAVDPKSETAGKHLRPGMVIAENQQPPDLERPSASCYTVRASAVWEATHRSFRQSLSVGGELAGPANPTQRYSAWKSPDIFYHLRMQVSWRAIVSFKGPICRGSMPENTCWTMPINVAIS